MEVLITLIVALTSFLITATICITISNNSNKNSNFISNSNPYDSVNSKSIEITEEMEKNALLFKKCIDNKICPKCANNLNLKIEGEFSSTFYYNCSCGFKHQYTL